MGLFGASINPGTEYAFRFTAAGKYEYSCSCSGSTGRVAIPVKILPAAGGTGVVRTVTWAVEDPAAGYVFDIQIKRPGIPGWTNWRTGVTTLERCVHAGRRQRHLQVQGSTPQHREQHALPVLRGEGGDGLVTVVVIPLLRLPVEVAIPAATTERNEEV